MLTALSPLTLPGLASPVIVTVVWPGITITNRANHQRKHILVEAKSRQPTDTVEILCVDEGFHLLMTSLTSPLTHLTINFVRRSIQVIYLNRG